MDNTKCQFCDEDISVQARICPHCQKTQYVAEEINSMAYNIVFYQYFLIKAAIILVCFVLAWWAGLIAIAVATIISLIMANSIVTNYPPFLIVELFEKSKKSFYIELVIVLVLIVLVIIYFVKKSSDI